MPVQAGADAGEASGMCETAATDDGPAAAAEFSFDDLVVSPAVDGDADLDAIWVANALPDVGLAAFGPLVVDGSSLGSRTLRAVVDADLLTRLTQLLAPAVRRERHHDLIRLCLSTDLLAAYAYDPPCCVQTCVPLAQTCTDLERAEPVAVVVGFIALKAALDDAAGPVELVFDGPGKRLRVHAGGLRVPLVLYTNRSPLPLTQRHLRAVMDETPLPVEALSRALAYVGSVSETDDVQPGHETITVGEGRAYAGTARCIAQVSDPALKTIAIAVNNRVLPALRELARPHVLGTDATLTRRTGMLVLADRYTAVAVERAAHAFPGLSPPGPIPAEADRLIFSQEALARTLALLRHGLHAVGTGAAEDEGTHDHVRLLHPVPGTKDAARLRAGGRHGRTVTTYLAVQRRGISDRLIDLRLPLRALANAVRSDGSTGVFLVVDAQNRCVTVVHDDERRMARTMIAALQHKPPPKKAGKTAGGAVLPLLDAWFASLDGTTGVILAGALGAEETDVGTISANETFADGSHAVDSQADEPASQRGTDGMNPEAPDPQPPGAAGAVSSGPVSASTTNSSANLEEAAGNQPVHDLDAPVAPSIENGAALPTYEPSVVHGPLPLDPDEIPDPQDGESGT
ncbi:hypothetical protein ASG60_18290 [Methylobacterium sp. Leaf469]|nr:hypothetical protein ASG60_18290 [Methylobacterium sp. Leaf469]